VRPDNVAHLLLGIGLGALLVPGLTGLWLVWREWRSAFREGTPIVGEGLERAKRRGDLP